MPGMAAWPFQLGERREFQLQGKLLTTEETVLEKKKVNIATTSGRTAVGLGGCGCTREKVRVEIQPPVREHLPSVGAEGERETINYLTSSSLSDKDPG